jgi:AAHS family benzoate transporter-like MFS transporter
MRSGAGPAVFFPVFRLRSQQKQKVAAMRKIDIQTIIDNAPLTGMHYKILAWCLLLLIFDGYDLFIYGVVLPVVMQEWGLTPLQAGALGSYALFGMMLGAALFGTLGDQIGRRHCIVLCCLVFSCATLLNGIVETPAQFGICRFFAGLGCGGLMPNVVALVSEYAPRKARSTLVAIMFCGYPLGGMLSAGVGIYVLPRFGWEVMFYAAALPLAVLPLIYWRLPESVGFLLRQGRVAQARSVLLRVDPARQLSADDELQVGVADCGKASFVELFRHGRATSTLMLWLAFFCCLLMIYALSSWLPKLMASAGFSLGSSLTFLVVLNVGAMLGAVSGGWLGDRLSLPKLLVCFLFLATLSIGLLGLESPRPVLYLLVAIAGATTIGTQILLYACAGQFYGLSIRSTGMGWASAAGRIGAIVGPLLGGALVASELPLTFNFMIFAIPGVIAALAMLLFVRQGRQRPAACAEELAAAIN